MKNYKNYVDFPGSYIHQSGLAAFSTNGNDLAFARSMREAIGLVAEDGSTGRKNLN